MQLSKIEILEIVAKTYTSKTRSVDEEGDCVYLSKDGKRCGAGLFLKPEFNTCNIEMMRIIPAIRKGKVCKEDFLLEVQSHFEDHLFWGKIQSLHDTHCYWNETGLSEDGLEYYHNFINNIDFNF
jgi:hypothetical protein